MKGIITGRTICNRCFYPVDEDRFCRNCGANQRWIFRAGRNIKTAIVTLGMILVLTFVALGLLSTLHFAFGGN